jgi:hypothetical protein
MALKVVVGRSVNDTFYVMTSTRAIRSVKMNAIIRDHFTLPTFLSTGRHIPQDRTLHNRRREMAYAVVGSISATFDQRRHHQRAIVYSGTC